MRFSEALHRFFLIFFVTAVILPIFSTLLFLFGMLLAALGDAAGAAFLSRTALAVAALWGTDLALLLLALTAERIAKDRESK